MQTMFIGIDPAVSADMSAFIQAFVQDVERRANPLIEAATPDSDRERIMAERDALADMLDDAVQIIERERLEHFNALLEIAARVDVASSLSHEQGVELARAKEKLNAYGKVLDESRTLADAAGIPTKPGVNRMALAVERLKRQGEEIASLQARVNEYADRINKAESEVIATGQVLRHMVRDRAGAIESAKGRLEALQNAGFHF